jgi:hypothetical protein
VETRKFISPLIAVFGELHDPTRRATYKSLRPVPVEFSSDGLFARLDVAGRTMTGRVLRAHTPQPVVYLGHPTPPVILTVGDGWTHADVPLSGALTEPSLAQVIALARDGDDIVCYTRIQWLDRLRLPMGRLSLLTGDPIVDDSSIPARVVALPEPIDFTPPTLVVAVDDAQPLRDQGWAEYLPDVLEALEWGELEGLTRCLESRSMALLGRILLGEVIVHDLLRLDVEALMFLPRGIRDGLEQALLALPDWS